MLISEAHADHSREFADFKFVYPVISRRAKGVSIGINCTEVCNYNCIYCQVLTRKKITPKVEEIIGELKAILNIYKETQFANFFPNIEEKHRILQDVAFSGNGEPTLYPYFNELCKELEKIEEIPKLVLITNATGIEKIANFKGEIWGKLDAGTNAWHKIIDRPLKNINLELIENNLKLAVSKFKLKIQTMLCKELGEEEIESYVQIVERIYKTNPQNFLGVQLYTVVRQTVQSSVSAVSKDYLEAVKRILLQKNSNLNVEVF